MSDSTQDPSDKKQLGHAYDWLGGHGQISYEQLMALAQAGTSESLERLHELADDNNISYDQATDPVQLAEEISSAMETDGNTGVE
jgi:hypothetical protein